MEGNGDNQLHGLTHAGLMLSARHHAGLFSTISTVQAGEPSAEVFDRLPPRQLAPHRESRRYKHHLPDNHRTVRSSFQPEAYRLDGGATRRWVIMVIRGKSFHAPRGRTASG